MKESSAIQTYIAAFDPSFIYNLRNKHWQIIYIRNMRLADRAAELDADRLNLLQQQPGLARGARPGFQYPGEQRLSSKQISRYRPDRLGTKTIRVKHGLRLRR